jgi:hypothetical protein
MLLLCEFQNRELLYSPGPQNNCFPSLQWHMVHSGGSMSPSVTSFGPTTLAYILDSLAHGTHSCTHIHSKQNPTVRSPLKSTTQIFSVFRGFRASGVRAPHISNFYLPKSRKKIRFTPPLNRTVNSLPTVYGVDNFEILGFRKCSPPSLPIY